MHRSHERGLSPEPLGQTIRQNRDPVLTALAGVHPNRPAVEIEVAHSEPQAFHHPQTGAIQQADGQRLARRYPRQYLGYLIRTEYDRNPVLRLRPHDAVEPWQFLLEHLQIHEQNRLQRLVLRRRRDTARDRQMREKSFDFPLAHLGRMPLSVKQDVPPHPHHVCALRCETVVTNAERLPNPIEQALVSHLGFPSPCGASFVEFHSKIRQ
jgi:hypothetical protein